MKVHRRALAPIGLLIVAFVLAAAPACIHAKSITSRQSNVVPDPCSSPCRVARAEGRLPVHPINPEVIVRYVTHLKLVSVGILPNPGNASIHRPNGPNTIQYTFGFIPPSTGNLFVRPRPRFVQVIETVEQRRASGISITPVLKGTQTTPIPSGYHSPLVLVDAQPQRHLTFFIESNIPRNRLRLLGQLLTQGGRAPGSMTPLQALSACETRSVEPYLYPKIVSVSGYLRVQRWKPSGARIYGFLFGTGSVPPGAEYNAHWVTYGGLSLGMPARVFRSYLSLTAAHPPVAWHGTLRCSGAFSRLHVEWFDLPLPTSG